METKDELLKAFEELKETWKKEGKNWGNPNLKEVFCASDHQPGIVWKPVEEGHNFECFLCGIRAESFCTTKDAKTFACNTCMWKFKP